MAELFPRPLLATRADADLYLPRPAIDDPLRRALDHGRNALVVGEHGSGRTSLLHARAREMRDRHRTVVYVDARGLASAVDIVREVARAMEDEGHPPGLLQKPPAELDQPLVAALRELPRAADAIVLLDDPPPHEAFELFGRQRDRLWEIDYAWVVATSPEGSGVLMAPPADAFFERRIELFPLSVIEKREVLARRAPELGPVAQVLMEHGPDNLRELIAVAARIVDGEVDPERYAIGVENRQRRAAALGHSAARALDEVAALEPVSASDTRLLSRLRWTKARASRVLNELEDAGLLTAEPSSGDGPGRPRKLYRVEPPELFA